MLAAKLVDKYRYENCAVVALDDGGVVVGAQIAVQLHCVLTLLNSAEIKLPLEPKAIGGITSAGSFAYNSQYTKGDLDDLVSENRNFIEQEKYSILSRLNQSVAGTGTIDKRLLWGRNIILVSEGLKSNLIIDMAYEFLKPVKIDKLIFAVPLASVAAVDRMHVMGDELICLSVLEDFENTNHFYDTQDVPDHQKIQKIIEEIVLKWK